MTPETISNMEKGLWGTPKKLYNVQIDVKAIDDDQLKRLKAGLGTIGGFAFHIQKYDYECEIIDT